MLLTLEDFALVQLLVELVTTWVDVRLISFEIEVLRLLIEAHFLA